MVDISTNVCKWHEWYEETSKHDDFIKLEDIISKESCMKHEIYISFFSLELVDPTSLRFIGLAPIPSLFNPFYIRQLR